MLFPITALDPVARSTEGAGLVDSTMRKRACAHEAGHAVAALLLGLPLRRVLVMNEGVSVATYGFFGESPLVAVELSGELFHYDVEADTHHPRRDRILDYIVCMMAGELAADDEWVGRAQDGRNARKYAAILEPDPVAAAALLTAQSERCRRFVAEHRTAIDRLAAHLEALPNSGQPAESLSAEEARRVIDAA